MSWGGTVAGAYTADHADTVAKLCLLAPQWLSAAPNPLAAAGDDALGAYRLVPVHDGAAHWRAAAPEQGRDALIPSGWFEQWADATLADDSWSDSRIPGQLYAVNGPVRDAREYWAKDTPYYDPSRIAVPVLLIHGEWDADVPIDAAFAFFATLTGAPYRRWTEIGEATHMVLLEKNQQQAISAVITFLQEDQAPTA